MFIKRYAKYSTIAKVLAKENGLVFLLVDFRKIPKCQKTTVVTVTKFCHLARDPVIMRHRVHAYPQSAADRRIFPAVYRPNIE